MEGGCYAQAEGHLGPGSRQVRPRALGDTTSGLGISALQWRAEDLHGTVAALPETGYTIVRLLQNFKDIEVLNQSEWREELALASLIDQPVTVRMMP